MWKKPVPSASVSQRDEPAPRVVSPPPPASSKTPARIGPSLVLKGELYGEEDLLVDGKVDGSITLKNGSVTVGDKGRVEADIRAVSIQIAGSVKGNLDGADRVVLMESGRVEGDIKAKSVILENGCRFKGSIDMGSAGAGATDASTSSKPPAASAEPLRGPGSGTTGGKPAHGPIRTP